MKTDKDSARVTKQNALRIFQNRDYACYFGGQLISQVGTWMQQIALSWLTYKLTNSPLLLAVVAASGQLPSLLVMPFAGVIADRVNRHRLVVMTQTAAMLQAGTLAYLTITNHVHIWNLIALGTAMGVINAFDIPGRSSFVYNLVKDKNDLAAAVAMNVSLMNISRLLGPAIAGFVVASVGEGPCFLLNSLSYIAVIIALLVIRGDFAPQPRTGDASVLSELRDGLEYAAKTVPVHAPILLLAVFGFGGVAYMSLLPVFVKQIGGNADTLGYLSSASALGSVAAAAILASRNSVRGMGRLALASSFAYAIFLFIFGFANNFWLSIPMLALLGGAMMLQMGCCNTILQSVVDEDKRGRVMSMFSMAFMGTIPLGSLVAGAIATHWGFQNMIFVCAAYCMLIALFFAWQFPKARKEFRRVYIERGLLESEEELQTLSKPIA